MMTSKKSFPQKSLVIFDMDGLFFDSERIYAEGWKKGFKVFGISVTDDFIHSMAGKSAQANDQAIRQFVDDAMVKAIRSVREDYFYQKLEEKSIPTSYFAIEMGELLKDKGYEIALASSSNKKRVYELLRSKRLSAFFDYVVTGDQVECLKPAPDLYYKVLKLADKLPSEAIAFEDSLTGVRAAQRAAIDVYLISQKRNQPPSISKKYLEVFPDLKTAYRSIFQENRRGN